MSDRHTVSGQLQYYAIDSVSPFSDKHEVVLSNISDKDAKAMEKLGLTVRKGKDEEKEERHDWGNFFRFKCKPEFHPRVVDANKRPWNRDVLIGNGSKANVVYRVWESKFNGKTFYGANPLAIQVIDLVPYEGEGDPLQELPETDLNDDLENLLDD